ncbi:MAG: threonine dehydratase [Gaiellales bacterium]|nr:threonine dehydratase [Gaiellales bacterium]
MIPLEAITRARATLTGSALRTPLVRPRLDDAPADIYLKLECLQPIGSFKIRGALNALAEAPPGALEQGVVTASAGNMAQGVAWGARERGIPCTVVVPDHAPQTKLDAIERLGGRVLAVPFEDWWRAIETSQHPGAEGYFVHPVLDDGVMAGNGTIGLEILDDLPEVDTVLVPWGGGGLACGIASALRQSKPGTRVIAVEPETGAPLTASLPARESQAVDYRASFVDGSGSRALLPKMWGLAQELIDGAVAVPLAATAAAVRVMVERSRVVAEGAGALALAAALAGEGGSGKVVCIASGGNIDLSRLAKILNGETPA